VTVFVLLSNLGPIFYKLSFLCVLARPVDHLSTITYFATVCVRIVACYGLPVDWSRFENFAPLVGHQVVNDPRCSQFEIQGLEPGCGYYVRVSAGNIKGFGPPSSPLVGIPSSKIRSF